MTELMPIYFLSLESPQNQSTGECVVGQPHIRGRDYSMKSLVRACALMCALSLGTLLPAQTEGVRLITVSPQTLDGWTVAGAEKSVLTQDAQLVLPAGAQLSRNFPSSAVILRLLTRPVFSDAPAEWPIAQVGQAALALIHKDKENRLILVINEGTAVVLPWTVTPSAKDAAVEIILAYDPMTGAGLVGLQDKLQSFESAPSAKPVEVVLSAGENTSWPHDLMQVLLITDNAPEPGAGSGRSGQSSNQSATAAKLKSALGKLLDQADGRTAHDGSAASDSASATSALGAASTLEVFTPPSVRRARTEAVRTIVTKSQAK